MIESVSFVVAESLGACWESSRGGDEASSSDEEADDVDVDELFDEEDVDRGDSEIGLLVTISDVALLLACWFYLSLNNYEIWGIHII